MKERSLKDLFYRVGRILPEEQELVVVNPNTTAREALILMKKHNLSQVPILIGSTVLGVFSYRSFSEGILQLGKKEQDAASLPVEVFSETLKFAQIHDELTELVGEFDLKDAVLVGSESRLHGIVTTVDALNYYYRVANVYIMLKEIELAIRELMRASLNSEELRRCIEKCIRKNYEEMSLPVPASLEEMSLGDYLSILKFKGFWDKFRDNFGGSYAMLQTKLERLPSLRNDVFHFRRDLTEGEYDYLRDARDWLLKKITKLESGRQIVQDGK